MGSAMEMLTFHEHDYFLKLISSLISLQIIDIYILKRKLFFINFKTKEISKSVNI